MIFNACQLGINVNLEDLSIHTLMAVNEYASKILKYDDKNANVPIMRTSDLPKEG